MSLYRYVKSPPKIIFPLTAISLLSIHKNKILVGASYLLIASGFFLIGNAVLPIVTYELFTSRQITQLETPRVLVQNVNAVGNSLTGSEEKDLIDPSNWFDQGNSKQLERAPIEKPSFIEFYYLSIPKLGIKNALVSVGGTNLDKSLVQYKGTASPGQLGNPVVFGHSVLPQFFNPKNYISIFSTLPTIRPGDLINVNFDGVEYKYEVSDLKEVKPTELSVLEQRYDRREITLITCTPPGTYRRRLVVKARLIENTN